MFKNMNIGKKLIIAFVVAILISSLAGIMGVYLLNKSDTDYSAVLDNYGFAQGELSNLGQHFQASRVVNLYVLTAATIGERQQYLTELATEDAAVDQYMLQVKARLGSELGQKVYAQLSTAMTEFRTARSEVFKAAESSLNVNYNISLYRKELAESSTAVREILATMVKDKTDIGTQKSEDLTNQTDFFTWVIIGGMVAAFIVAMVLAVYNSRKISKPLKEVEQAAIRMAQGDYDVQLTYISGDEVGSLAENMRKMMETTKGVILDTARALGELAQGNFNVYPGVEYIGVFKGIEGAMVKIITDLSDTLAQIKIAADQVSSGSDQVSSGSQALAQGATEQASSVQQLSASINEVSQQIKENAEHAKNANSSASTVGEKINSSNQQMSNMMKAMAEISDSSSQISKIIKTIEDIAFQTNILALNAAVEAARAGSAGKGFAVVADEVRNLANKSSEAAKQTNALIESSVKSVENGVKIADETAKSLGQVVVGAQEITELIGKITRASSDQSTSIAQINLGVEQISSVVQTNSATSEESAAASEELSGQANVMKSLVAKFRLKHEGGQDFNEPTKTQSLLADLGLSSQVGTGGGKGANLGLTPGSSDSKY